MVVSDISFIMSTFNFKFLTDLLFWVIHCIQARLFSVETEEEKSIFDNPHHLLFDKNFTGTTKSEKTLINN